LKSVFIIAILTVAMIGMMVPSAFAFQGDFSDIEIVISDD
jgi:hypothetical protein